MREALLAWSPARPRRAGWYWIRRDGDTAVVRLQRSNRGLVAAWPGRYYPEPIRDRDYDDAEWCGPLDRPPG